MKYYNNYRLAILNSHPVQYFVPMYRRLALETNLYIKVYYCSRQGMNAYTDPGFGQQIRWDMNLTDGYHHEFLNNIRRTDVVGGFFSLINPGIISELYRERFDALWVHGHNYATCMMAMVAAKVMGIPILMRCETHLLKQTSRLKSLIRRPVMSLFYRNCAACLAIGTRNTDFYRYHGVPEEKIKLVPYTVDNSYFGSEVERYRNERASLCNEFGHLPDVPVILYASKLTPRKNPMHLLQAYHRLRQKGIDAALIFVGSGSEDTSLKTYARQHNLDNVYFLGFVNQSQLPKVYAVADIFVLPSVDEPWGLIINEVMCAGLPVIASAEIGAVPDLVHDGENGFTFEAGDIDMLQSHLETLCRDRLLRERMGKASREIISQWSYEECVQGVLAALDFVR